jgi:hypothetical protein
MTVLTVALSAWAALAFIYWSYAAYALWRSRRSLPRLRDVAPPSPAAWPRLSVIVAARDEAEDMEAAARSLLAQDYPDLELVLVDDRSSDSTGAIIDRLAAEDPRVRPVHVTALPDGWLGKVHALQRGLEASSGALVLFTDADVHFQPATLGKAVAWFEAERLDHAAGLPRLWPSGVMLGAVITAFLRQLLMAMRPWAVSRPGSRAFMGVGAFNMVRRRALDATEGLQWLRLEIADDMGLGLLMKRSGARCAVVAAGPLVGLHWYRRMRDAVRAAEKAWGPGLRFSVWRALPAAFIPMALEMAPLALPWLLAAAPLRQIGWAGLAVLAAAVVTILQQNRNLGGGHLAATALGPLLAPIPAYATLRAAWLGWRRGGLRWRDTFYSTETLRQGARVRIGA